MLSACAHSVCFCLGLTQETGSYKSIQILQLADRMCKCFYSHFYTRDITSLLLLHLTEQVQSLFDPIRFFREARQHGSRYPRALSPQCPIDSWKRSQLTRLDSEKIHGAENPPTNGLLNRKIIYEW